MPHPQQNLSARERKIETEPDSVQRVLKAVVSGNSFSLDSKTRAQVKQIPPE